MLHDEPRTVLHLYVAFDSDWYVPYGSAEVLTTQEATSCYLEALELSNLPVPTTPYNPLVDTVEITADRSDMESFRMYSLAPVRKGGLLYTDVDHLPSFGWRITINNEVVFEDEPQSADDDTAEEAD